MYLHENEICSYKLVKASKILRVTLLKLFLRVSGNADIAQISFFCLLNLLGNSVAYENSNY